LLGRSDRRSYAASPADRTRPAAINSSMRARFFALHRLPTHRGVNRIWQRPASTLYRSPSIEPEHNASSIASSHVSPGTPRRRSVQPHPQLVLALAVLGKPVPPTLGLVK